MLVVPNESLSIYTRLWCAYEAYLACSQDKYIYTAVNPLLGPALCRTSKLIPYMLLAAATEVIVHAMLRQVFSDMVMRSICMVAMVFGTSACFSMGESLMTMVAIRVCAAIYPFALAFDLQEGYHRRFWLMCVAGMILNLVGELGRYYDSEAGTEIKDLRNGFDGRIQKATCSRAADDKAIRDDIEKDVGPAMWQRVDSAIEVLLSAGKSTPDFRRAADLGVDLDNAGRVRLFPLCFQYVMLFMTNATMIEDLLNTSDGQCLHLAARPRLWWVVCCSTVVSTAVAVLFTFRVCLSLPGRRDFMLNANGAIIQSLLALEFAFLLPPELLVRWKTVLYKSVVLVHVYISIQGLTLSISEVGCIAAQGPCGSLLAQLYLPQGTRRRFGRYLLRASRRNGSDVCRHFARILLQTSSEGDMSDERILSSAASESHGYHLLDPASVYED